MRDWMKAGILQFKNYNITRKRIEKLLNLEQQLLSQK